MKQGLGKVTAFVAAMVFALGVASLVGFAASQFEGTWKTKDTKGNPFEIVLSVDGTAKGDRSGEGLNGKWKEEGDSAVIEWGNGWTTKITKMGDQYKKTAYEKGKSMGETETQKVK
jgi:hypothetical protein